MTPLGEVAQAAADVLAARLAARLPGLSAEEVRDISRDQADELRRAGWSITAPVKELRTGRSRGRKEAQS